MEPVVYFSLFASVVFSGLIVLKLKISPKNLKLLLSFSGAFLFSISVIHLLPELYEESGKKIGIFILAGFFLQILLELFSEGIEHGHIHIHKKTESSFPFTMMAGLCIHSFLEGIPLSGTELTRESAKEALLLGIVLHNIPVAVALMTMLLQSGISRKNSLFMLLLFALMAPAGMFSGVILVLNKAGGEVSGIIMAMVIGIFLHISTTILFETSDNHRFNLIKFITILVGAGAAFLTA